MLRKVAEAGISEVLASREEARRACSPDQMREHSAREQGHVARLTALMEAIGELRWIVSRVLLVCIDFPECGGLLAEQGAGLLDRLPPDLGAALRDGDWSALVPLALAFADELRARLHAEHPDLMAFAEGDEARTLAFVREALEDDRRGAVDNPRRRRLDTPDRDHDGGGNRDEG